MVKADPKHDYYADLECKPNADAVELKKAFKKLALKYHPDRNRGNEDEASHRFQDIQCAHEILTDPEKRAKYDADRWRQTLHAVGRAEGSTDSPPRSPFVVNTGFPPPPRRTQPPPPRPGPAPTAKNPSAGADRYANIPRNFTQTRDEQAKAQAYSAWNQMKHRGNQPGPPPPPRRPPRPTSYAGPNPGTAKARAGWEDTPPPKAAPPTSDPFMERANGMPNTQSIPRPVPNPPPGVAAKSPKRPAFFPGPENPEEPPVSRQQSAYYNVSRGARPPQPASRQTSQYAPPPPPPTAAQSSGFRHVNPREKAPGFKVPLPPMDDSQADRLSTPYATAGGEKTYFNSDSINHSASTAANMHAAGQAGPRSRESSGPRRSERHRSASPHMRSPRPPDDYSSSSSSDSTDSDEAEAAEREKLRPKSQYARRASADDRINRGTSYFHPDHPSVRVDIEEEDDALRPRRPNGSQYAARPPSAGEAREGFRQHRMRVSPGRSPGPNSSVNTQWGVPVEKSSEWHAKYGAAQNGRQFDRPATADLRSKSPNFVPPPDRASGTSTKNSSTENVDKRFSASDWQDKFIDPNTYLGAQKAAAAGPSLRGRSPPKPRSATAAVFPQNVNVNATPPASAGPRTARPRTPNGPVPSEAAPAAETAAPKFSQEQWAHHFKEASWAYPPQTAPLQGTKAKPRTPRKMSVSSKKATTPKAASVASSREGLREETTDGGPAQRPASTHSNRSAGSAMDIDPKVPTPPANTATAQPSMAMKNDPIANIIRSAIPLTAKKESFDPSIHDEFHDEALDFEELKKTAPLGPGGQGLNGMGELATMLPFKSQPSMDANHVHGPRELDVPPTPETPAAPTTPIMTPNQWEIYVSQFDNYLHEWNMYNARMIKHFEARHNALAGLPRRWTSVASGEGLTRYVAGLAEDFRVREHWDASWVKHRDALAGFAKARAKAANADLLEEPL